MTRFGKRHESLQNLVLEAVKKVKEDSGIEVFDAIFVGIMNPDEFTGDSNISTVIGDFLGMPLPSFRIETASSSGAAAFHASYFALASRHFETVLVIAAEKMTHLSTPISTKIMARVISPTERAHGATMPALAALVARRYMRDYGLDSETLGLVAVKNHHNATMNPHAHFQKEVSLEKVLNSRLVADPLRLYDCAPISDGACAVVLTSKKKEVKVKGLGHATDTLSLAHRDSLTSFRATQIAAKNAYSMANISAKDVDVAEVHDAFAPFEIIDTEDLGFFERGKGGSALSQGITALSGDLPINTSGGLKARGHPVGASGLAQIIEIYLQLTGCAQKRQVDGAKIGLAQSIGGLANNNLVTVMEASK